MARDPGWLVAEVSVETPAGTSPSAPQSTSILTGWLYINTVRYRFPPGPMGCLGWYLTTGGNQIIPWPPSQPWIIGNDEEVTLDYAGAAGAGLTLVTANVGNYNHQILLTIEYYDIATVQAGTVPPALGITLLSSELLNEAVQPASAIEELFQVNEQVPAG